MNSYDASLMNTDKRLDEISGVLAAAILRLHLKKQGKRECFPLDNRSKNSLHGENKNSDKTGGSS